VPLSTKLAELKASLATEEFFGPISIDHQRIFYLGRELKSGGRSLSKLGVGKFKQNRVLHMHIRPGTQRNDSASKTNKRRMKNVPTRKAIDQNPTVNSNSAIVDLLGDSDDEVAMIENPDDNDKRRRIS
jgi:hypothetical protein